jgi:acyl carrier protein
MDKTSSMANDEAARPTSRAEVERLIRQMTVDVLMLKNITPQSIDATREDFLVDLGANSVDALELIVTIEERLGIEFNDEQLNADLVKTLARFIDAICEKLSIPGAAAAAPPTSAAAV